MHFSSIWPINRTLSSATTLGQSGPGSNGNEVVLSIPQSSSITGTSPTNYLISYPGHSLEEVLPLCRSAVGVFYSPCRLGNIRKGILENFYCLSLFSSRVFPSSRCLFFFLFFSLACSFYRSLYSFLSLSIPSI